MMQKILISAVIVFVTSVPAFALTISYTTSTPIPLTLTDWTKPLSFQQFNPSLGTLEMVQLDLSMTANTVLSASNNSDCSASGHIDTHIQMAIQDEVGNFTDSGIDLIIPTFYYNLTANQSMTPNTIIKSDSSSGQYTAGDVLSEFTGSGEVMLVAGTFTESSFSYTGCNAHVGQLTYSQLNGTVTYSYAAEAPEPATVVLLAFGALALLKRKNRE
jgi:hypothetical protein